MTRNDWDFTEDQPPGGLSGPVAALWWLAKGGWKTGTAWENAHELSQNGEGTMAGDWVHGLAHWIEGDEGNSNYWYRRAGQSRFSVNAEQEWAHILNQLR